METPILFIIFKRFDTTYEVFKRIREARPRKLYIAADAPRDGNEKERIDCEKTREIINYIDWPCEVHTLFQNKNKGCGIGPASAISWLFDNEEMGIVLEDDCLPSNDFFPYCEELLHRYKDDERISLITGRNPLSKYPCVDGSYFLSALHFCWGWASWKRVWQNYDYELKDKNLFDYYKNLRCYYRSNPWIKLWRMNIFMQTKQTKVKSFWDYQFVINTQFAHSYTIVPKVNLITNIGFDENATHTAGGEDNCKVGNIIPLEHPNVLRHEIKFDETYGKTRYKAYRLLISFPRNLIKYFCKMHL